MTIETLTAFAQPVRHEANNLLAAISGTVDILLRTAQSERDLARAARLREATDRLEALLKAYFALAAPPAATGGVDGAQLLALMRPLIVLTLGPGRLVEIEAAPGLPRLAASPAALQAEILGLARAAAAGAPAGGGLRLTLREARGGATLAAAPLPEGPAPAPVFLPAAGGG